MLYISTFYKFSQISDLDKIQGQLEGYAEVHNIKGLFIIASEGVNATFSSPDKIIHSKFKLFIQELLNNESIEFKDSTSEKPPFRIFKVKKRPEIVTLNQPELIPDNSKSNHLSPSEWLSLIHI